MGFNTDFVTDKLLKADFEILSMEEVPETNIIVLTIIHDLHPDIEVQVSLITKDEAGEDTMEMQFNGPDDYTDLEAKQVLQEVTDFMVSTIEQALEEVQTPVEGAEPVPPETPEEPTGEE